MIYRYVLEVPTQNRTALFHVNTKVSHEARQVFYEQGFVLFSIRNCDAPTLFRIKFLVRQDVRLTQYFFQSNTNIFRTSKHEFFSPGNPLPFQRNLLEMHKTNRFPLTVDLDLGVEHDHPQHCGEVLVITRCHFELFARSMDLITGHQPHQRPLETRITMHLIRNHDRHKGSSHLTRVINDLKGPLNSNIFVASNFDSCGWTIASAEHQNLAEHDGYDNCDFFRERGNRFVEHENRPLALQACRDALDEYEIAQNLLKSIHERYYAQLEHQENPQIPQQQKYFTKRAEICTLTCKTLARSIHTADDYEVMTIDDKELLERAVCCLSSAFGFLVNVRDGDTMVDHAIEAFCDGGRLGKPSYLLDLVENRAPEKQWWPWVSDMPNPIFSALKDLQMTPLWDTLRTYNHH